MFDSSCALSKNSSKNEYNICSSTEEQAAKDKTGYQPLYAKAKKSEGANTI